MSKKDDKDHIKKWNQFLDEHELRHYKKGEIILLQDEVPQNIFIIKEGVIKTYDIDLAGEEKTIAFDHIREIFPIGWAIRKIEKTQYFYSAFTDCDVYVLSRDDFEDYLDKNPQMGCELYKDIAHRFLCLQLRIKALEQSKAPDKIIHTLAYLCERFGSNSDGENVVVELALTQQELSDFIGLTRETISVELKKLEKEGLISYKKKKYSVNLNKLNSLIGK